MALFFDQEWFDTQLKRVDKTHEDVGKALQLSGAQVRALWKDQYELTPRHVTQLAELLAQPCEEITRRAGVSTPRAAPLLAQKHRPGLEGNVPENGPPLHHQLHDLSYRLQQLEQTVVELKGLILDLRKLHKDKNP